MREAQDNGYDPFDDEEYDQLPAKHLTWDQVDAWRKFQKDSEAVSLRSGPKWSEPAALLTAYSDVPADVRRMVYGSVVGILHPIDEGQEHNLEKQKDGAFCFPLCRELQGWNLREGREAKDLPEELWTPIARMFSDGVLSAVAMPANRRTDWSNIDSVILTFQDAWEKVKYAKDFTPLDLAVKYAKASPLRLSFENNHILKRLGGMKHRIEFMASVCLHLARLSEDGSFHVSAPALEKAQNQDQPINVNDIYKLLNQLMNSGLITQISDHVPCKKGRRFVFNHDRHDLYTAPSA